MAFDIMQRTFSPPESTLTFLCTSLAAEEHTAQEAADELLVFVLAVLPEPLYQV